MNDDAIDRELRRALAPSSDARITSKDVAEATRAGSIQAATLGVVGAVGGLLAVVGLAVAVALARSGWFDAHGAAGAELSVGGEILRVAVLDGQLHVTTTGGPMGDGALGNVAVGADPAFYQLTCRRSSDLGSHVIIFGYVPHRSGLGSLSVVGLGEGRTSESDEGAVLFVSDSAPQAGAAWTATFDSLLVGQGHVAVMGGQRLSVSGPSIPEDQLCVVFDPSLEKLKP